MRALVETLHHVIGLRMTWWRQAMRGTHFDTTDIERVLARLGSVALATDERDFGRDECYFLKLDGFVLPMHKTGRQKTA